MIGLGSMGKRRIQGLLELGVSKENIRGFDIDTKRREEVFMKYDIIVHHDLGSSMLWEPNVFFICTPPHKHLFYQKYATRNEIPCFTEASVCIDGLEGLDNKYIYPSATMRFNQDVLQLKQILSRVKCTKFEYRCCSYLPDWHPNENINDYYVSKKKTGACREIVPFELEWLIWIFGDVKRIKGLAKSTGQFGEIDDIYQVLIEFKSGIVGYMIIDIITREARGGYRKMRFNELGEAGVFEKEIVPSERMYKDELQHFLDCIGNGSKYHYSLSEDVEVLKLLEEIEK